MRIETYQACAGDAPTGRRFLAYIELDGEFLPVRFSSATEDGARAKAQEHWDAATEKAASTKPRGRPKRSDIGIPITDQDVADPGDVI